jgi:hypothetical protein
MNQQEAGGKFNRISAGGGSTSLRNVGRFYQNITRYKSK